MKYKIFVSGVQKELKQERFAVKERILKDILLNEYFNIFLFEDSPAKSKSSQKTYMDELCKCDIYIGIIGNEYGVTGKDELSATERELRKAQKCDKHILIYIKGKDDTKRDTRTRNLISSIRHEEDGHKYKRFDSILELENNVYESAIDFLRAKGIVGKTAFDDSICENATFEDIDNEKIRWFLEIAKAKRNYPLRPNTPAQEVFTHLDLSKKDKLSNASILLFGKNPNRFHLQAEIKCIQFPGTEIEKPFLSYHRYDGNLFEQIDKSLSFVLDAIRLPVIQQPDSARVKRPPEIPIFAIREAIVNAAAHRNYNNTGAVQVMVFTDRVEIWNPGKLPQQLTIQDLKKPHTSYPANPLLSKVLYLADYTQEAGSGIREMIKQCNKGGLPEPQFQSIRGVEFHAILARDIFTEEFLTKFGLSERQQKAVKYIKEKEKITNREYQELCKVKKRQATDDLKELEGKKVIKRIGKTGKGTYYILKGR